MFFAIGTASANSVKSGLENVTPTPHNVTLTLQKPCQYNNKFDYIETNGYNIPHDAIYEVYSFFSIKYRYSDILLKKKT